MAVTLKIHWTLRVGKTGCFSRGTERLFACQGLIDQADVEYIQVPFELANRGICLTTLETNWFSKPSSQTITGPTGSDRLQSPQFQTI